MSRTFAYCRVSTVDQHPENQLREIESAGFHVEPFRVVSEKISGGVAAANRPGFSRLLDKMEPGDVLVVSRLDRLGRNALDVRKTVDDLAAREIRVHCLALGGVDLTSSAGRMTMQVIAAVAEFEKDLIIERTQAGLARAHAAGRKSGRRPLLSPEQKDEIRARLSQGESAVKLSKEFKVSRQTVMRCHTGH